MRKIKVKGQSRDVIWEAQEGVQAEFLSRAEFEVIYGGSAGGGKTDALLMGSLRQVEHEDYRGIIFRRKMKQLRNMIDRSQFLFRKAFQGAVWKESEKTWVFPSGARVMLWHMEEEKHKYDHDGQQYQYIGFDELTHFTESQYMYLYSRARSANPLLKPIVRASAMPMGIGVGWVKNRFIDNGAFNVITDKESGLTRLFIPAKLEDNKALMEGDPQYEQRLKLMGHKMYQRLRHGNWDVIEGASFEELSEVHRIPRCIPPKSASAVFRALDWGYSKPFSVGWYFETEDGALIKFMEWYGCKNGEADKGLKMDSIEVAQGIKKLEEDMGINVDYGVADPACWSKADGGNSVAENMRSVGIDWDSADNDRIQGKMELHNRLKVSEDGKRAGFYVTENCKHFWRTVPMLQDDERRPEDVDTKMEDHSYDETRYALMSRGLLNQGASRLDMGEQRVTTESPW